MFIVDDKIIHKNVVICQVLLLKYVEFVCLVVEYSLQIGLSYRCNPCVGVS